ncbi:peptide chain release factor N(5)-glutamine methyltransferase [Ruminococcus bromii]|uniref:peptide chain release factor N(5)-glutamine methyltransferase n=1 Tax=Ruminococcus bromii TaxID=40518 RepID=UPI002E77F821|nr:peptide chain release factor N(5)-glutamine methyltransferase [Ruminococcus bromii]MEE0608711.1 peptide chain release factor N(5)-glutamine methyltransferase [Ruminococcus bromii]
MTVNEIYQSGLKLLENNNIENSKFEAQSLLQKAFSLDRVGFIIHKTDKSDENCSQNFLKLIEKRISGEPLQYILGEWSFMGFDFKVGRGVLIPRDDTEVVVNLCIDFLKNRADKKTVDLCSGSGAIAVALDKISGAKVTAVEIDETAFSYLETNVKENNSSVKPVMADALEICETFADGELDLIVSNPPYIKSADIETLQKEVQLEPRLALDGGEDGCDFYREIVNRWSRKLKKGGALAFELGEGQADAVKALMTEQGFSDFKISLDFGGVQRAIIGTLL